MDLITIGESMVLFIPQSTGPLRYVNGFQKTIGGAESNVCIALSRLGHQTGWISHLGNDEFGLYLRNYIRGEGVDTSGVKFDENNPTAVFFKETSIGRDPEVYYYREGSAASKIRPEDLDDNYISQAKFIHLTGITPALSLSCKATIYRMIEIAYQNKQTIIFDPNIRLKLWEREEAAKVLLDIAQKCHIVMPGIEEGELLTGEKNPKRIAELLLQGETEVVVVKLGEQGAYCATKKESFYVAGKEVSEVIDTAGAGDGFAAGFLSGLIRGWDYKKSVTLGNQIGAYAVTVIGDVEGYPYWSQIDPDNNNQKILR